MSRFSTDDYTRAMLNLLPSGIAWNRLPDSVQYRLIRGLVQAYRQSDADACALITGAFPETTDVLIDEWYESLGLNSDCGTQASTADKEQARKFILAKLLSTGGQSVAYFTELAATMGYSITVREHRTPLCGFSRCGHLLSDDNRFNWTVVVSPPGDEVSTSREYLECLFRRYAPAHTLVTFEWLSSYSAALSIAWDDSTHILSGEFIADEGVVVSGVTVNVVIKSASGQRYVATVATDGEGHWSFELEEDDFANGWYSAYAEAVVDMPDDVTVPVRSELINLRYYIAVKGIALSVSEAELDNGDSITVTVNVFPENAENRNWFVSTGDDDVVNVRNNGDNTLTLTGRGEGVSVLMVMTEDGGHTAVLNITGYVPAIFDVDITENEGIVCRVSDAQDMQVNWGEGYQSANDAVNVTAPSSLREGSSCTVKVRNVRSVSFYSTGGRWNRLTRIRQLPAGQTSGSSLARGRSSLTEIDAGALDFCAEKMTTFASAFHGCTALKSLPSGLFAGCTNVTTFASAFHGCTALKSLPSGLFAGCTNVTTFASAFYGCTSLESLPSGLFAGCTNVTTFASAFYGCTSLESLPSGLFTGCTNVTTFASAFHGCTALKNAGEGVFSGCSSVTSFYKAFYECTALESLPEDTFSGCTGVTTFASAFYGCSSLTVLPSGLFRDCVSVTCFSAAFGKCAGLASLPESLFERCIIADDFSSAFSGCTGLTALPGMIFSGLSSVTDFSSVFYGCSALKNAGEGVFSGCSSVTSFYKAFYECTALESLPEGMFSDCTNVTTFAYAFYGCTSLASLPSGLFSGCAYVTTFEYAFYRCSGLTLLPEDIFTGCESVTSFSRTFGFCTGLISVPGGLFTDCSAVTTFIMMFSYCSGLSSLPASLFRNCGAVKSFEGAFYGCSALGTVPEGIFDNSSGVTTFKGVFLFCTGLTSLPASLFRNCGAVKSFESAFYGCSSLTALPDGLFSGCGAVTSFANAFYNCSSLESVGQGIFTGCSSVTDFYQAFLGCTSLASDINTIVTEANGEVTRLTSMFSGCAKLRGSGVAFIEKMSNATAYRYALRGCYSLDDYEELVSYRSEWVR